MCRPIESENSSRTETEDAVSRSHPPRHHNLDDVVDEHAQLSAPSPTIHHVHISDPSPPPEHTLAVSTQTTGTAVLQIPATGHQQEPTLLAMTCSFFDLRFRLQAPIKQARKFFYCNSTKQSPQAFQVQQSWPDPDNSLRGLPQPRSTRKGADEGFWLQQLARGFLLIEASHIVTSLSLSVSSHKQNVLRYERVESVVVLKGRVTRYPHQVDYHSPDSSGG